MTFTCRLILSEHPLFEWERGKQTSLQIQIQIQIQMTSTFYLSIKGLNKSITAILRLLHKYNTNTNDEQSRERSYEKLYFTNAIPIVHNKCTTKAIEICWYKYGEQWVPSYSNFFFRDPNFLPQIPEEMWPCAHISQMPFSDILLQSGSFLSPRSPSSPDWMKERKRRRGGILFQFVFPPHARRATFCPGDHPDVQTPTLRLPNTIVIILSSPRIARFFISPQSIPQNPCLTSSRTFSCSLKSAEQRQEKYSL